QPGRVVHPAAAGCDEHAADRRRPDGVGDLHDVVRRRVADVEVARPRPGTEDHLGRLNQARGDHVERPVVNEVAAAGADVEADDGAAGGGGAAGVEADVELVVRAEGQARRGELTVPERGRDRLERRRGDERGQRVRAQVVLDDGVVQLTAEIQVA